MTHQISLIVVLISSILWTMHVDAQIELVRGTDARPPQQPQLAVDSERVVHAVYGMGDDIYYQQSTDEGRSFSNPVRIDIQRIVSLGMRRGPRIAASKGALCITVIGGLQGKGRDGDLVALVSSDGGTSWSPSIRVNDVESSAREGLHAMAAGPNGQLVCAWLDLRHGKTEIMASVSHDGGRSWNKNVLVYRSPDGSVCECCHPSVCFDEGGTIYVQWRNSLGGNRDMFVAGSSTAGETYDEAEMLGAQHWKLAACPMDGGALAASNGQLISVWRHDKQIYCSDTRPNQSRVLGEGEQPWCAYARNGAYFIWLRQRNSDLLLQSPGGASPRKLAELATDPVIAAGPHGNGPVVAAWESRADATRSIVVQVLDRLR